MLIITIVIMAALGMVAFWASCLIYGLTEEEALHRVILNMVSTPAEVGYELTTITTQATVVMVSALTVAHRRATIWWQRTAPRRKATSTVAKLIVAALLNALNDLREAAAEALRRWWPILVARTADATKAIGTAIALTLTVLAAAMAAFVYAYGRFAKAAWTVAEPVIGGAIEDLADDAVAALQTMRLRLRRWRRRWHLSHR